MLVRAIVSCFGTAASQRLSTSVIVRRRVGGRRRRQRANDIREICSCDALCSSVGDVISISSHGFAVLCSFAHRSSFGEFFLLFF